MKSSISGELRLFDQVALINWGGLMVRLLNESSLASPRSSGMLQSTKGDLLERRLGMTGYQINSTNVGRMAERIVATELEARGFRVSDLNKDGLSANADLLAVRDGTPWQIQVKGATNPESEKWWIGYGHCSQKQIDNRQEPFFNQHQNRFYVADVVVLVAVCSPRDYRCIVLPIAAAENAVQISLDADFRLPKRNGEPHKPGKVWCDLNPTRYDSGSPRGVLKKSERDMLLAHEDKWEFRKQTE